MDTVRRLLETCGKDEIGTRDRAIILTLLDTGLRAGELLSLNIEDVDLKDGSIVVRKTKNRKGRIVFVGQQARRAIARYLALRENPPRTAPLWLAYHTDGYEGRLSYDGLREIIRRRARMAGINPPTLHSFRRAFALTMLRNGVDLISLSRMMGHGSLPVLLRYLKHTKEDLIRIHQMGSPVDTLLRS
jgi:integrase/recombinase XerC/integrase/recombinase XerD